MNRNAEYPGSRKTKAYLLPAGLIFIFNRFGQLSYSMLLYAVKELELCL